MFIGVFSLSSCHSSYKLVGIEGGRVEISSVFDSRPDKEAIGILTSYKAKVDSVMSPVIGRSEIEMEAYRPESTLSNFAADILRQSVIAYRGRPADVAVTNVGGLRSSLPKGNITSGDIYEIFPFENSLCILEMSGKSLKDLFVQIAKLGGEGLSGARLVITHDGMLKEATVGGAPVKEDKIYLVATIDYLAEGNDGMKAFLEAREKDCPENTIMRRLVVDYIKKMTKENKAITSAIEGRITKE